MNSRVNIFNEHENTVEQDPSIQSPIDTFIPLTDNPTDTMKGPVEHQLTSEDVIISQMDHSECINCKKLHEKLLMSRSWNRFFKQKLINIDKVVHIVNEFEREKQKHLELQLAYDQRTREWVQQQEQLINLLNEVQPLREQLRKAEEILAEEKKLRLNHQYKEQSLSVANKQLQAKLSDVHAITNPAFVESLEKKLKISRAECKKLKRDVVYHEHEVQELRSFLASKRNMSDKLSKKLIWALRTAEKFGLALRKTNVHATDVFTGWPPLMDMIEETEAHLASRYEAFNSDLRRKFAGRKLHLSRIPVYEQWLQDYDVHEADEETEDVEQAFDPDSTELEKLLYEEFEDSSVKEDLEDVKSQVKVYGKKGTNKEKDGKSLNSFVSPKKEDREDSSDCSPEKETVRSNASKKKLSISKTSPKKNSVDNKSKLCPLKPQSGRDKEKLSSPKKKSAKTASALKSPEKETESGSTKSRVGKLHTLRNINNNKFNCDNLVSSKRKSCDIDNVDSPPRLSPGKENEDKQSSPPPCRRSSRIRLRKLSTGVSDGLSSFKNTVRSNKVLSKSPAGLCNQSPSPKRRKLDSSQSSVTSQEKKAKRTSKACNIPQLEEPFSNSIDDLESLNSKLEICPLQPPIEQSPVKSKATPSPKRAKKPAQSITTRSKNSSQSLSSSIFSSDESEVDSEVKALDNSNKLPKEDVSGNRRSFESPKAKRNIKRNCQSATKIEHTTRLSEESSEDEVSIPRSEIKSKKSPKKRSSKAENEIILSDEDEVPISKSEFKKPKSKKTPRGKNKSSNKVDSVFSGSDSVEKEKEREKKALEELEDRKRIDAIMDEMCVDPLKRFSPFSDEEDSEDFSLCFKRKQRNRFKAEVKALQESSIGGTEDTHIVIPSTSKSAPISSTPSIQPIPSTSKSSLSTSKFQLIPDTFIEALSSSDEDSNFSPKRKRKISTVISDEDDLLLLSSSSFTKEVEAEKQARSSSLKTSQLFGSDLSISSSDQEDPRNFNSSGDEESPVDHDSSLEFSGESLPLSLEMGESEIHYDVSTINLGIKESENPASVSPPKLEMQKDSSFNLGIKKSQTEQDSSSCDPSQVDIQGHSSLLSSGDQNLKITNDSSFLGIGESENRDLATGISEIQNDFVSLNFKDTKMDIQDDSSHQRIKGSENQEDSSSIQGSGIPGDSLSHSGVTKSEVAGGSLLSKSGIEESGVQGPSSRLDPSSGTHETEDLKETSVSFTEEFDDSEMRESKNVHEVENNDKVKGSDVGSPEGEGKHASFISRESKNIDVRELKKESDDEEKPLVNLQDEDANPDLDELVINEEPSSGEETEDEQERESYISSLVSKDVKVDVKVKPTQHQQYLEDLLPQRPSALPSFSQESQCSKGDETAVESPEHPSFLPSFYKERNKDQPMDSREPVPHFPDGLFDESSNDADAEPAPEESASASASTASVVEKEAPVVIRRSYLFDATSMTTAGDHFRHSEDLLELVQDIISTHHSQAAEWKALMQKICDLIVSSGPTNEINRLLPIVRVIVVCILRSSPYETKEVKSAVPPTIFKLLRVARTLSARLDLDPFAVECLVNAAAHRLVLEGDLRPNSLTSLTTWVVTSCSAQFEALSAPEDEDRARWCRAFLGDLCFRHKGRVHDAILSVVSVSKRIFLRNVKYREWTVFELSFHWIAMFGQWDGRKATLATLKETFCRKLGVRNNLSSQQIAKDAIKKALVHLTDSETKEDRLVCSRLGLLILLKWVPAQSMVHWLFSTLKSVYYDSQYATDTRVPLDQLKQSLGDMVKRCSFAEDEEEEFTEALKLFPILKPKKIPSF